MKRITVDTNVLISATFWNGASSKILQLVEDKKCILILSAPILEEFAEVLEYDEIKRKVLSKNLEMKMALQKIVTIATIVEPNEKIHAISRDPDDNMILECAIEGNVDFIITNDKDILDLKEFRKIKVMTPEEFLKQLRL